MTQPAVPTSTTTSTIPIATTTSLHPPVTTVLGVDVESVDDEFCGSRSGATGLSKVNGLTLVQSLKCGSSEGKTGWIEFDLSRAYGAFQATVGLADDSSPDGAARFEVLDETGRVLVSTDVVFGTSEAVSVDVTDVLRLRLQVTGVGGGSDVTAVWGNPVAKPPD